MTLSLSLADYQAAAARIAPYINETPCLLSSVLSEQCGHPVWLKHEQEQETGAFKLRGATNAVLQLPDGAAGVTTASTGNHGRALAHAAVVAGLPAVICLSELVPYNKRHAIELLGAEARVIGDSQDAAMREAERLVAEEGFALIPPFDDMQVIAGQGTLGLEMAAAVPGPVTVLVPLSGGGLLAGVAGAMKALNPETRIIGVTMERGAAMAASLEAGKPVDVREVPTLADSLGGGIGMENRHSFAMVQALVDEVILVSEAEIAAGIRFLYLAEGATVEGAAAVGVAAMLGGRFVPDGPVILPLTGGNIDPEYHKRIINGETPDLEDGPCPIYAS
ncbi:hydroxyectoine utilization dehydratase EutB [Szabonella alba]|uniref:Hydroxyectoine utilization dehydratase EutB n=1 Tax=Szabonella alba TaxID=2804194 RepID=A0A8K0VBW0_9RHOB|nr:hydroxyectoine utilization dehydratase EutB [Szabonella alba]MBL4916904.1 hydroxyectoine utilization dehydratase EutB [Szabonella alba]